MEKLHASGGSSQAEKTWGRAAFTRNVFFFFQIIFPNQPLAWRETEGVAVVR